ncbi:MAG TPA: penicillin acylase family protein [Thermoanaerobaculia bacterium]|nr:penicillin acylase family protein [Thermoanaerobaculia bacterium]HUM29589.1 penicillin acylase family protein [Thermoanaerobaculia bacterium]HXK67240.1 penicillin acylase family protein [Thermoanaerobaculia bacterium]
MKPLHRSPVRRWKAGCFLALLLVSVAVIGSLLWIRSRIPDLPREPVPFDKNGIPTLTAQTEADLAGKLGEVHAVHRRLQMEMVRRFAEGRISELLGDDFVELDRVMRLMDIPGQSREALKTMSGDDLAYLEAYAEGVNRTTQSRKPPLLASLGGIALEPWEPACSLYPLGLMAWDLARNFHQEIFLLKASSRVPPERLALLFPAYPGAPPLPLEELQSLKELGPFPPVLEGFSTLRDYLSLTASNAWALAPSRTRSGSVILASDPHLAKSFPPLWYAVRFRMGDLEGAGLTLPGVPVIGIGHTAKTAWGFTNVMADTVDLTVALPEGNGWTHQGKNLPVTKEILEIGVRGGARKEAVIHRTPIGPVITEAEPGKPIVILRSAPVQGSTLTAFRRLLRAKTVPGVLESGRDMGSVAFNLVTADKEGTIGWHAVGNIPVRDGYSGIVPTAGKDPGGFLDYDDLPHAIDPPEGFLVSANERTDDRLSHAWCAPYRKDYLDAELSRTRNWGIEEIQALQMSVKSRQAEILLPELFPRLPRELRDPLEAWDRKMVPESAEAALWIHLYEDLTRALVEDELGELYSHYLEILPFTYPAVDEAITHPESPLWDDVRTETTESFEDVVSRMSSTGSKPWGEEHTYWLAYPAAIRLNFFPFSLGRFPYPGDLNTVNLGGYNPARGHGTLFIASMRFTVEFKSGTVKSWVSLPGGQSEHIMDPLASNLFDTFLHGEPLAFDTLP